MNVRAVKTHKIVPGDDLLEVIDTYISAVDDRQVLAVTSKVVALCEGAVVAGSGRSKHEIAIEEADRYLPPTNSKYDVILTVKNHFLIPNSGVDESNVSEDFVLWPRDSSGTARVIREHLQRRCELTELGVVITDSSVSPLRWGTTGFALGASGFRVTNSYIGHPDIHGQALSVTRAGVADGLAAAAVVVMGEGAEQTPLAILDDIPFVDFVEDDEPDPPLTMEDDLYAPLLRAAPWINGGKQ